MPTGKTQNTCLSRHGQSLLGPHRVPLTESAVEQTGFVFALPSAADAAEKKKPLGLLEEPDAHPSSHNTLAGFPLIWGWPIGMVCDKRALGVYQPPPDVFRAFSAFSHPLLYVH